jgi:hypothetical protein
MIIWKSNKEIYLMYEQIKQPNTNITWIDEDCLIDVRTVFGIAAEYLTAIANWNANSAVNHPNETPPSNIAVPIFFSCSNPDGHVCLWDNGTIYTSSAQGKQIFTSIQALINWMGQDFKYLGWSEEIESTRVVQLESVSEPSGNVGKTLHLSASNTPFHVYPDDGPYEPADAKGEIIPAKFGGLSYTIIADKGNGIYVINTADFGQGAIWTSGSNITIE